MADIVYDGVLDGDWEGVTDGLGVFDRVTEGLSEPDAEMKRRKRKKTMIHSSRSQEYDAAAEKINEKNEKGERFVAAALEGNVMVFTIRV